MCGGRIASRILFYYQQFGISGITPIKGMAGTVHKLWRVADSGILSSVGLILMISKKANKVIPKRKRSVKCRQ